MLLAVCFFLTCLIEAVLWLCIYVCADLEISDLVNESEAGLSFSRTPGQLLSLTSHLSFVRIQFWNNDCVYVVSNETSGRIVCLISCNLKCYYIFMMIFKFWFQSGDVSSNLVLYGYSYVLLLWFLLLHIVCILYVLLKNPIEDSYTNLRFQDMKAIKFCTVVTNVCGSWVWNLIHVVLMVSRVLRWF